MMIPAKKESRKGFTLAELLIVVGIIAVLVGIAIPVFSGKVEKSREAYDIHTMRQAASAAIELCYAGVTDEESAKAAGLLWNSADLDGTNASGVYDPGTGKFLPRMSRDPKNKAYGKGTKSNGGTKYTMGNVNGAYDAGLDYTNAVVLIAIYPKGNNRHVDVYWKDIKSGNYIGGRGAHGNDPKLSIRIPTP